MTREPLALTEAAAVVLCLIEIELRSWSCETFNHQGRALDTAVGDDRSIAYAIYISGIIGRGARSTQINSELAFCRKLLLRTSDELAGAASGIHRPEPLLKATEFASTALVPPIRVLVAFPQPRRQSRCPKIRCQAAAHLNYRTRQSSQRPRCCWQNLRFECLLVRSGNNIPLCNVKEPIALVPMRVFSGYISNHYTSVTEIRNRSGAASARSNKIARNNGGRVNDLSGIVGDHVQQSNQRDLRVRCGIAKYFPTIRGCNWRRIRCPHGDRQLPTCSASAFKAGPFQGMGANRQCYARVGGEKP